ncbi:MAG: peptidoglycan DD-metalloendopeptidase family protein [Roseiflexaceae bacterium]|nr:peptidoglycan DD-metalloendopeptidase family protein [Roseiflexaceae bacterium]
MNRYIVAKNHFVSTLLFVLSSTLILVYTPVKSADNASDDPSITTTPPEPGYAVIAKPATLSIIPPFRSGDKRKINLGYKSGTTHNISQCSDKANGRTKDCFALDFGGNFDVVAVADGTVRYSGWSSGGFGEYGQIVYICHGKHLTSEGELEICSLYAHLSEIEPGIIKGFSVNQGQLIGKSGRSYCGSINGYSEKNAHLHFALYAGGSFQEGSLRLTCRDSGGIGPYNGYAVVPEPFTKCRKSNNGGSCENLRFGDEIESLEDSIPVDLLLLIDTTGSMWDDIEQVKDRAVEIIESVKSRSKGARIAIMEFRDFPERTGYFWDYPYRDVLPFTTDEHKAIRAIYDIRLGYGGDIPETLNCALAHAIRNDRCDYRGDSTSIGSWRNISTKIIIYMTDAPALSPEPFTGFTLDYINQIAKEADIALNGNGESINIPTVYSADFGTYPSSMTAQSPVRIFSVVVGDDIAARQDAQILAEGTGGQVFTAESADDVVDTLLEIIDMALPKIIYLPLVSKSQ